MVFLWFSYGFPMVFLWFSYGFPMVFLWFSYAFLWFSYAFPMLFLWFSYGFPIVFLWFSYGFPMLFLWFSPLSPCQNGIPGWSKMVSSTCELRCRATAMDRLVLHIQKGFLCLPSLWRSPPWGCGHIYLYIYIYNVFLFVLFSMSNISVYIEIDNDIDSTYILYIYIDICVYLTDYFWLCKHTQYHIHINLVFWWVDRSHCSNQLGIAALSERACHLFGAPLHRHRSFHLRNSDAKWPLVETYNLGNVLIRVYIYIYIYMCDLI